LKNYELSDDIAFRFSDQNWDEYPLTSDKYAGWINDIDKDDKFVNLFMDYETFGEHQWEDTGIFNFMKQLPKELFKRNITFKFPSEIIQEQQPVAELDIHHAISWADLERDLSAWLGNKMQHAAITELYALDKNIKSSNDPRLIEDWRKLQTSDHFYYMCTKWFSDGNVHEYFTPYASPYEAFINYMNVLSDFQIRLNEFRNISKAKNVTELIDISSLEKLNIATLRKLLSKVNIEDLIIIKSYMNDTLQKKYKSI